MSDHHSHVKEAPEGKTLWGIVYNREMVATQEEMNEANLPLGYRDYCAHLLIDLNKCRHETMYLPWKCGDLRHAYEKCQFFDYQVRQMKMAEQRGARKE